MSSRSLLVAFIFALQLAFAQGPTVLNSYSNLLDLKVENLNAPHGVDIWMSRDGGKSWVQVGRTFRNGENYSYRVAEAGRHDFHFHARSGIHDRYRPNPSAKVHLRYQVEKLEEENDQIQYSNNRRLSISYRVKDIGVASGGKYRSRLYVTRNSGLSWNFYGVDEDGQSPMNYNAPGDGLYGFKIVSIDEAGQEEPSPNPGTPADVLVRVDTNPPTAKLISPQPMDLWEAGTLRTIRWTAHDESLNKNRCVALYYSVNDESSWTKIADGLPATGQLAWTIPDSKNGKIYMRVEAMDRSRNVGRNRRMAPFFTRNILEEMLPKHIREQANIYYQAGSICRKNGERQKAIKYFRLCHQLNPYHVPCHNDISIVLMELGQHKDAFKHLEIGLKYAPSRVGLLFNMAKMYMSFRQYDVAREILVRLIHLNPRSVEGLWLASEQAQAVGDFKRARAYWKRILDLDHSRNPDGERLAAAAKKAMFQTHVGRIN